MVIGARPDGHKELLAKATAKVTDELDILLAFLDFPPSTMPTSGPPTPSSRPSRPYACGPE